MFCVLLWRNEQEQHDLNIVLMKDILCNYPSQVEIQQCNIFGALSVIVLSVISN